MKAGCGKGVDSWPLVVLVGVSVVLSLCLPRTVSAQVGLVRIYNQSRMPAIIVVQNSDFAGYRKWQPIGRVAPGGYADFPGVPTGALFGAHAEGGERQWPPFRIVYPFGGSQRPPIFEYRLRP